MKTLCPLWIRWDGERVGSAALSMPSPLFAHQEDATIQTRIASRRSLIPSDVSRTGLCQIRLQGADHFCLNQTLIGKQHTRIWIKGWLPVAKARTRSIRDVPDPSPSLNHERRRFHAESPTDVVEASSLRPVLMPSCIHTYYCQMFCY